MKILVVAAKQVCNLTTIDTDVMMMISMHMHCNRSLQRRHNEHNGVANHRRFDCLPSRLFRRRSKKISKLRVSGLCEGNPGNPPVTGGFPSRRASNAEILPIYDVTMYPSVQLILGEHCSFVTSLSIILYELWRCCNDPYIHQDHNKQISQIPQCTSLISHNSLFYNRKGYNDSLISHIITVLHHYRFVQMTC